MARRERPLCGNPLKLLLLHRTSASHSLMLTTKSEAISVKAKQVLPKRLLVPYLSNASLSDTIRTLSFSHMNTPSGDEV